jgi:phosphate transport system protein
MTHLDTELKNLKASTIEMWELVINQLNKSNEALQNHDKELANEVLVNEKRVDAFELKLNMDCENILALFNPVANDLRLVLAVLRINSDLERIGDYTKSIAKIINDMDKPFDEELVKKTHIFEMYKVATNMLNLALESFEKEDNQITRKIFKKDDELDKVNDNAIDIISKLIKKHPEETVNCLYLFTTIKRIERVGDQTKNIAEEIIFYIEAKVLRHKKKKEKLEE